MGVIKLRPMCLILILLSFQQVFAEVVSIPLSYTGHPAKDLVGADGKVLSVIQAKQIYQKTKDLSQLDPKENDVWKNQIKTKLSLQDDDYSVDVKEVFKYVDKVISPIGSFRFLVRETKNSQARNFNIWLSKDSRSILLRKNLLRKLGYIIPKVQHKQKIQIKFSGKISMKAFLEEAEVNTFADVDRWKIAIDEKNHIVTLQDVLIFESNSKIYNLAMGDIGMDNIKHRRVLNSLSLPYALADLRESVDGFTWHLGKIDNKVFLLDIISGEAFTTTYFDAKWMVNRIAQLDRNDINEIVDFAYFPHSVGLLLKEKLISRINSIQKAFNKNYKEIKVNPNLSDKSKELVRGRLTQDTWDGHASRYSFDDTESPLSKDEMFAYFRSKAYSAIIENLVSYFNDNYLYETNIQEEAIKQAQEAQREQFIKLFETGKFEEIPFSTWAVPTAKGHIAASRNIVTGAYLGTDNLIQIADSLEFIGEVGAFIGTLGVPAGTQLFAMGNARFSRSYTHVKSIKSIKAALKEPFRNMIVPYQKRRRGKSIITLIDELKSEEFVKLEGEERTAKVEEIYKELGRVMSIGDSLIISNNLIGSGSLLGGYSMGSDNFDIELMLQLNARKLNLWRLHILRRDEYTFQVYRSRASSIGKGFGIQSKALIPIVTFNYDKQSGSIQTKFQSIRMNNQDETDVMIRKLTELRQVLVENSTELLNKSEKPFVITHNFSESAGSMRFLHQQAQKVNLTDHLKIKHPEEFETEFYIRSVGNQRGKNYIQVAYDVLNGIIEEVLEVEDVGVSNTENGNPGDSFYGESFSRRTMTEVPFNHEIQEIPFENYAQVKSQWKGWKAGRAKLMSIKKILDKKYGKDIFDDEHFYDTGQIQLYTVDVILSIYARGLDHLTQMNHDKFMNIIESNIEIPWPKEKPKYRVIRNRRVNLYRAKKIRLIGKVQEAHRALNSDYNNILDPSLKSKYITTLVDVIESTLPFKSLEVLLGGDENYYLKGSINGFRSGRENGEEAIISHALGEFGSEFSGGIIDTLREAIQISQGELGAYWFLRRLQ